MKFGLCVVGCGDFAWTFADTVQSERGWLDLYFASRDEERAQAYAARFDGAGFFGSYEAAAADPRVDALYVCTPHHLHLEHVGLAAQAGKHVLLEKPIARTVAEGEEIVALAGQSGVTLMVAENYRFLPPVAKAKELVDTGALGKLRLVQLQEQYPYRPAGWRSDAEMNGGGVFIDGGIHKASILAYLAGPPSEIYGMAVPPGQPGLGAEDGMVALNRYDDGLVGIINHSWAVGQHTGQWASISGSDGSAYFELDQPWVELIDGDGKRRLELAPAERGLAPMVRDFRQAILEGREPSMTGAEGVRDLAMVLKAYESMRAGAPLPFP
jgi:predicted dehydrogenase